MPNRSVIIAIAAFAGCMQNQFVKDVYDDVESESQWRLQFGDGRIEYADRYPGPCPVFTTTTVHVPDGPTPGCSPGCTCSLFLSVWDEGDDWAGVAYFDEKCPDGSLLDCDLAALYVNPRRTQTTCGWLADPGTLTPAPGISDCDYAVQVDRIYDP